MAHAHDFTSSISSPRTRSREEHRPDEAGIDPRLLDNDGVGFRRQPIILDDEHRRDPDGPTPMDVTQNIFDASEHVNIENTTVNNTQHNVLIMQVLQSKTNVRMQEEKLAQLEWQQEQRIESLKATANEYEQGRIEHEKKRYDEMINNQKAIIRLNEQQVSQLENEMRNSEQRLKEGVKNVMDFADVAFMQKEKEHQERVRLLNEKIDNLDKKVQENQSVSTAELATIFNDFLKQNQKSEGSGEPSVLVPASSKLRRPKLPINELSEETVSYTHLTLPTILLV